ncbi:MAG: hypothetical protein A3J63_03710 [Candidatus Moranbacteria bacterium RIFCSPHIGHO2_02_FULL_40_12b]|nr:MAG: hypothetical protein A3J63_03710 [Candidatus Moranbacteria bacterium RIFCSPHIGHO2_02_FULL_40_12b]OGI24251.1 MAG: hypothetical protein A3E91_03555 [Candidatus Moranbacteria bacterium RIFCSPHIGHO2_12_FULL_40_10]
MELKEYIAIFKKNFRIFLLTVGIVLIGGLVFYKLTPLTYKIILDLNVTRTGIQETGDYQYDNFYRLQADERFADTVARWLGSPWIQEKIYSGANAGSEQRKIKAQRLSSQFIQVTFVLRDRSHAKNVSRSIVENINKQAEELNKYQKEKNWFTVLGNEPVVRENKIGLALAAVIFLALGIFIGIWVVFIKNYFNN